MKKTRRALRATVTITVGLFAIACGKTDRPTQSEPAGGAGADAVTAGRGGAPAAQGGSAAAESGSAATEGGAAATTTTGGAGSGGQEPDLLPVGGAGEGGTPSACIEGAACQCGDLSGTLHCGGSAEGECSCPAAEACQNTPSSCFEPCGGNPLGVWVLERTCFSATSEGTGCEGAFLDAVAEEDSLRLEILENEPVRALGSEGLTVTARVPLSCLGLETVARCSGADFYAAPLLYSLSRPLACEASDCGRCDCSGRVGAHAGNGFHGGGEPWQPGSTTLSFGAMVVPYCVEGDTLWAGGRSIDGAPKAAYLFRRRSCSGTPTRCEQRSAEACEAGGCTLGRCVSVSGEDPDDCGELGDDEILCGATTGCRWDPQGCSGTPPATCDFRNCDETPGCVWGESQARCGGQPAPCWERELAACADSLGCSPRTCHRDGLDDGSACSLLTTDAVCANAVGCSWNGVACAGVTTCGVQTHDDVCEGLGCFVTDDAVCGGLSTRRCGDLTVADCSREPGCRLEW